jgi:DNA-binding CsgD family transcriptional regulator
MISDRAPSPGPTSVEIAPIEMVVIGGAWIFTSQTCRHVEMEFHINCVQVDSLEQVADSGANLHDLKLLIVDQGLFEDLLERPEDYQSLNPTATIALGYRSAEIARRFLRMSDEDRHGQIGYLPMNAPLEVLLSSIRMLFHKEYFVPRCLLGPGIQLGRAGDRSHNGENGAEQDLETKYSRLTRREKEVLKLVSEGDSNKAIAKRLGITEHTVKLHLHNLSSKFGVSNRTAAANLYFAAQKDERDAAR